MEDFAPPGPVQPRTAARAGRGAGRSPGRCAFHTHAGVAMTYLPPKGVWEAIESLPRGASPVTSLRCVRTGAGTLVGRQVCAAPSLSQGLSDPLPVKAACHVLWKSPVSHGSTRFVRGHAVLTGTVIFRMSRLRTVGARHGSKATELQEQQLELRPPAPKSDVRRSPPTARPPPWGDVRPT